MFVILRYALYPDSQLPSFYFENQATGQHTWTTSQATIFYDRNEVEKLAKTLDGVVVPISFNWGR